MPTTIVIKNLDAASFAPFGKIIENPAPDAALASSHQNEFQVVDSSDNSDGWRLATIIVRERSLSRMGHHPNTKESFEPVTGVAVICVAPFEDSSKVEAFLLDRPVLVNASVWHGMIALSREAVVKIAENREVIGVNVTLEHPLHARVVASSS